MEMTEKTEVTSYNYGVVLDFPLARYNHGRVPTHLFVMKPFRVSWQRRPSGIKVMKNMVAPEVFHILHKGLRILPH